MLLAQVPSRRSLMKWRRLLTFGLSTPYWRHTNYELDDVRTKLCRCCTRRYSEVMKYVQSWMIPRNILANVLMLLVCSQLIHHHEHCYRIGNTNLLVVY
jgi:hypothetical protein